MRQHSSSIGILAIACGLLTNASIAQAAIETWVSGTGSNAGTCSITAPCRTFQFAHNQTSSGGILSVLSSGNFGPLTITKAISIVANGVEAAILGGGAIGAAIKIQAGVDDIVSLRGLTIDLRGTANDGISFVSGAALHVQNCVIRRSINGINFAPAFGTFDSGSELYVADSVIADTSDSGIFVRPSGSGGAQVVLDRVRVENSNGSGIVFLGNNTTGSITATVRDSVSAGSRGGQGIVAFDGAPSTSGTTQVMVDRSASVNNAFGIMASGVGATIRIGDSTVAGNDTGLSIGTNGVIASYGTNKVNGNGNDGAATGAVIPMK